MLGTLTGRNDRLHMKKRKSFHAKRPINDGAIALRARSSRVFRPALSRWAFCGLGHFS
jgi:hypothetical protein